MNFEAKLLFCAYPYFSFKTTFSNPYSEYYLCQISAGDEPFYRSHNTLLCSTQSLTCWREALTTNTSQYTCLLPLLIKLIIVIRYFLYLIKVVVLPTIFEITAAVFYRLQRIK
jgi:hypothetical protein